MELLPAVDIECVNNPIQVSFCADNSIKSTEFGGECHFVAVNSDETTQQHRGKSAVGVFFTLTFFYRVCGVQFTCSRPAV